MWLEKEFSAVDDLREFECEKFDDKRVGVSVLPAKFLRESVDGKFLDKCCNLKLSGISFAAQTFRSSRIQFRF